MTERKPVSKEEMDELIKLIAEAYKQAGKQIETMMILDGDNSKMIIDNRKEEEIN